MHTRTRASWIVYVLGALSAGAIVAAILVVGPASGSQTTVTRTATVARGVVQSTVSGSGNLQPASQLDLGFKTSGTVTHIYVTQGQYVVRGQLLATLDPQSAEVTLEQSKAALLSAEAALAKAQETDGETSTGQDSAGSVESSGSGSNTAGAALTASAAVVTAPAETPTGGSPDDGQSAKTTTKTKTTTKAKTPTRTIPTTTASKPTKDRREEKAATTTSSTPTVSAATREANLASARAMVRSDRLTVQSDEQAVQDTKLYAPGDGTIVSLSGQVGEVVSASGTTKVSSSSGSSSSSSSGSGSSATGTGASSSARTGASSSAGSSGASDATGSGSSGSGSSTAFAVLSDLSSMQLVVPLSESEIGNVRNGQIATVTVEALEGRKLAAHVSEVSTLSSTNSGVVSYDVTFQLDQMETGLKPGMSATAEVVVKQAEGVNVPTSAITAGSVTVLHDGKQERRRVVAGLAGNSSTIVLSGLRAGEEVALPVASTSSGAASLTSRLAGLSGRTGGGLGGSATLGAGGGGAFFRGGGPGG